MFLWMLTTVKRANLIQPSLSNFLYLMMFPLFFFLASCLLSGCASSDVSRDVTAGIDLGVQNSQNLASQAIHNNIADAYQNTSQRTKGALLGGLAGAITGAMSSSIGLIPGTATGAILGASYGAYIDSETTLEDRLKNRGANVIVLGDQIMIVIPSARLFNEQSADIKPQAFSTLEMVAQYINQYTKMLVKVAAYTNDTGSTRAELALSRKQAANVSKFLLASGIDARLLVAEGYGGTHQVEKNTLNWDASENYRIEITLEKLYV